MAGFANVGELAAAIQAGQDHYCSFRKVPTQAAGSTGNEWLDLSMAAGNPVPQYYAASPLEAAALNGQKGLFHGADKSPATKWLYEVGITTSSANARGMWSLLDYVLYYPFVDLDDTSGPQSLVNTVTLPRYTTGEGLRAMLVCVAPTSGTGGTFTYDYVNQAGVSKTSPVITVPAFAQTIATLLGGAGTFANQIAGPYLPLAAGDTGIRSISSFTALTGAGGLGSLVLVKPLVSTVLREVSVVHEMPLYGPGGMRLTKIEDGAYLGWIVRPVGALSNTTTSGHLRFAWN